MPMGITSGPRVNPTTETSTLALIDDVLEVARTMGMRLGSDKIKAWRQAAELIDEGRERDRNTIRSIRTILDIPNSNWGGARR